MSSDELPPLDFTSAVMLLGDAMSQEVRQSLEGTGLRHSHGYLVQRLLAGPATATEIAADLGITQQAVSKAVKELVGLGVVDVVTNTSDKRSRPVHLTDQGRQAVATSREARRAINHRVREALGDDDFEHTLACMINAVAAFDLTVPVQRRKVPLPTPDFV
jgi:DNA-binding MarR family transcriptional regulator